MLISPIVHGLNIALLNSSVKALGHFLLAFINRYSAEGATMGAVPSSPSFYSSFSMLDNFQLRTQCILFCRNTASMKSGRNPRAAGRSKLDTLPSADGASRGQGPTKDRRHLQPRLLWVPTCRYRPRHRHRRIVVIIGTDVVGKCRRRKLISRYRNLATIRTAS